MAPIGVSCSAIFFTCKKYCIVSLQVLPKRPVTSQKTQEELTLLSFTVKDVTGKIDVTVWGDKADDTELNINDVVCIERAERSSYNSSATVNTHPYSSVTVSMRYDRPSMM